MARYVDDYSKLLKDAVNEAVSEKWAAGILTAWTLAPYEIELLGFNRGRMLKKTSSPGKNRHKYLLDNQDRIIYETRYIEETRKDKWLHAETIYKYEDNAVIAFVFEAVVGAAKTAELQRVIYAAMHSGKVTNIFNYCSDKEYVEIDYHYDNEHLISVKMRLWYYSYSEREFQVSHEVDSFSIVEIADGERHQVFPPA